MQEIIYITGIIIGSIAAEMATSLEEDFTGPLTAMVIYALVTTVLSWISTKSIKARRILEGNGKLSILPKTSDRPATPADFSLMPQQEYMVANVIIDGKIMRDNLRHTGKDEKWLLAHMKGQGATRVEEMLLACCSMDGQLTVFLTWGKYKALVYSSKGSI